SSTAGRRSETHPRQEADSLRGRAPERARQRFTGLLSGLQTRLPRARIGIARIDDQRADALTAGKVPFTDLYGCSTKAVRGEHTGDRGAGRKSEHSEIFAAGLADAGFCRTDLDAGYRVNV